MCGSDGNCISYFAQHPEGIYWLWDVVVDGRITLQLISTKYVPVLTVSSWCTVTNHWIRKWTVAFHSSGSFLTDRATLIFVLESVKRYAPSQTSNSSVAYFLIYTTPPPEAIAASFVGPLAYDRDHHIRLHFAVRVPYAHLSVLPTLDW
jgi:hypothetical protein